jgi:hypothetical protein
MGKSLATAESATKAGPQLADDAQTAEYIGDLVGQLERLARTQGLVRLQYLLSVCREEAEKIANGG